MHECRKEGREGKREERRAQEMKPCIIPPSLHPNPFLHSTFLSFPSSFSSLLVFHSLLFFLLLLSDRSSSIFPTLFSPISFPPLFSPPLPYLPTSSPSSVFLFPLALLLTPPLHFFLPYPYISLLLFPTPNHSLPPLFLSHTPPPPPSSSPLPQTPTTTTLPFP